MRSWDLEKNNQQEFNWIEIESRSNSLVYEMSANN